MSRPKFIAAWLLAGLLGGGVAVTAGLLPSRSAAASQATFAATAACNNTWTALAQYDGTSGPGQEERLVVLSDVTINGTALVPGGGFTPFDESGFIPGEAPTGTPDWELTIPATAVVTLFSTSGGGFSTAGWGGFIFIYRFDANGRWTLVDAVTAGENPVTVTPPPAPNCPTATPTPTPTATPTATPTPFGAIQIVPAETPDTRTPSTATPTAATPTQTGNATPTGPTTASPTTGTDSGTAPAGGGATDVETPRAPRTGSGAGASGRSSAALTLAIAALFLAIAGSGVVAMARKRR
ncbi:MAG: hypothetical protein ACKVT1_10880 [Dehalococcoidia bacterium]